MCIAGVGSSAQTGHPTINGNAMIRRVVHPLGMTFLSGLILLDVGCRSASPAVTDTLEPPVQAAKPIRDRELELTILRAEMAATRIAAAKKEAELLELRDLVKQLRLENAESRQAFLELQAQSEQRKQNLEKEREEHARQAQVHATQDLSALKDTVVTLAQELGQLRQDLAKPVAKERVSYLKSSSLKPPESGLHAQRSHSPQHMIAARQSASLQTAMSSVALTVMAPVPDPHVTITVQPGDTLVSLAKRHRTTVEILRKLNALDGIPLIVGRELVLPTPP